MTFVLFVMFIVMFGLMIVGFLEVKCEKCGTYIEKEYQLEQSLIPLTNDPFVTVIVLPDGKKQVSNDRKSEFAYSLRENR
ncbi:hypothetical protein ABIE65_002020 [Constrictibacter sp. MBR-5]|jgi:hypothetical protein